MGVESKALLCISSQCGITGYMSRLSERVGLCLGFLCRVLRRLVEGGFASANNTQPPSVDMNRHDMNAVRLTQLTVERRDIA